jgi:hypothetical protein
MNSVPLLTYSEQFLQMFILQDSILECVLYVEGEPSVKRQFGPNVTFEDKIVRAFSYSPFVFTHDTRPRGVVSVEKFATLTG